ncbi:hypothetical protein ABW19_dt0206229 [Dactylella cylindrospora]|nr:hypothetical protein ABW19_dt0206229 [Dactylella cylindrospora]
MTCIGKIHSPPGVHITKHPIFSSAWTETMHTFASGLKQFVDYEEVVHDLVYDVLPKAWNVFFSVGDEFDKWEMLEDMEEAVENKVIELEKWLLEREEEAAALVKGKGRRFGFVTRRVERGG